MNTKLISYCFGFISLLAACKHETQDKPTTTSTTSSTATTATTSSTATTSTTNNPNDSVCFNTAIQPLFNSSCAYAGCHDAITRADGYNFTNYTNIRNQITPFDVNNGKIMRAVKSTNPSNRMPPGAPLSTSQIQLLEKWIQQGARNTQCNNTNCDTLNITYNTHIAPIIQTQCASCHASQSPLLGNFTQVKEAVQNGRVMGSIKHESTFSAMPKNLPKLNPCNIRKFELWIFNNYPQ